MSYDDPFGLCIEDLCIGEAILVGSAIAEAGGVAAIYGTAAAAVAGAGTFAGKWLGDHGFNLFRGGENPAAAKGRAAHKAWNPGASYVKEFTLPSGKRCDAYDPAACHVKELKPDNERAKKRGEKQAKGYAEELEKETGKPHTWEVETYNQ